MTEPIRVLHVLQRMEAGGTQALLMNIYRKIDKSKVQFDFLVHYEEEQFYDKEIESMGGKIYRFSVREDYNFIKYIKELNTFFKNHNEYKIVHGHMYTLGFLYLTIAKAHNIPIRIAHSHNNSSEKNIKWLLKKIMARLFTLNATDLFACSNEAGNYLFRNKKFEVWNNAIDAKAFITDELTRKEIRSELGVDDKFVVGHVGRFQQQKNHKFLVDIFYEIKQKRGNAILCLVGTGDLEDEIKEKINSLGLEKDVMFLGNRKDMTRVFQAMDVFLFPSFFEGLGIVAIESQASGIPSICSNALPEETRITPLITYLALEASVKEWAKVVLREENNMFRHKNMCQYIVDGNFDIQDMVKKVEQFYLNKAMKE